MRFIFTPTLILLLAAAGAEAQSGDCRYEDDRSQSVPLSGARLLDLASGSGSVRIEGKAGLSQVVVRGKACASDKDLLDEIKLNVQRSGDAIVVEANVRDQQDSNWGWRLNQYARLDIVVEVPEGLAADIEDGSGAIEISDLGALDIHDGSGEIHLADIRGGVTIRDGSGEIELRNIDGAVEIRDGSGQIDVRGAKGNVRIRDGSGSIDVADVGGDFIVEDDGSGSIDYENVRGRVDIPRRKHR